MDNKPYILISGSTSDIGKAISEVLSEDYPLLIHGRDNDKLEELINNLNSNNPIISWVYDLTRINEIKKSLDEVLESKNIQIMGFVHCAGMLKLLPIKSFREDYVHEIFNVNLFSAINILQTLLSKKNVSSLQRIIFISSITSKRGDRGNAIYSSSKGAIDSLVKSLALELAPNINVNSILPAGIPTRMTAHIYDDPEKLASINYKYPIGYGTGKDIALMVRFLLGDGGRWITAQNLHVDGGSSMF